MAAPFKPWERAGVNQQNVGHMPNRSFMSSTAGMQNIGRSQNSFPTSGPPVPPPRPYRPSFENSYQPSGYNALNMYGSPYMPYSSSYGLNYGYNRYPARNYGISSGDYNSFARLADESSRPAFQSIESIVHAFSSVSMMLDSTFQALYNSFRAVIGVADNFSRLKSQISSVISAIAIVRTLKYFCRKILELLHLQPHGTAESAWIDAANTLSQTEQRHKNKKFSSWPILMFFSIILGAPWLIWKIISSLMKNGMDRGWATQQDEHHIAYAEYNLEAENQDELSFVAGQKIILAPRELQPRIKGWLLASIDGKRVGLVPANYIKMASKEQGRTYASNSQPKTGQTFGKESYARSKPGEQSMKSPLSSDKNIADVPEA